MKPIHQKVLWFFIAAYLFAYGAARLDQCYHSGVDVDAQCSPTDVARFNNFTGHGEVYCPNYREA